MPYVKHTHTHTHIHTCTCTHKLTYRDIKSSNVLVKSDSGECAIADLGLALQLINTDNPKEIMNYGQASLCGHVTVM